MSKFFLTDENIFDDHVVILGEDAKHIARVLRMKIGDPVMVCDSAQMDYFCTITEMQSERIVAQINRCQSNQTEPPFRVYLFQAVPKSDKMDSIVQKAVECGVYSVIPILSERCVSRPEPSAMKRKTERWQKIAESAAKQCGRGIIPKVGSVQTFSEALKEASKANLPILCYEGEDTISLPRIFSCYKDKYQAIPKEISVLIGPEGGFSETEVLSAKMAGMTLAGLGKRILRTETASAFFLACTSFAFELLNE